LKGIAAFSTAARCAGKLACLSDKFFQKFKKRLQEPL
jgi:hypothetical protein